jgi:hypothetical protein
MFSEDKNMSNLKLLVLCSCGVLLLAQGVQAAPVNLVQNPRFITAPPADPCYFAANWQYLNTETTTTAVLTRLAPGVRMASVASGSPVSTTDRGIWQAIPVVAGATYQVNASWRGNFITDGATTNSGTACRIYVAYGTSETGPWSNEQMLCYKKLGYNRVIDSWNVPASLFFPSNQSSYSWTTWEDASNSPCTNHPIAQDIAVVPDGMTYMRLRLNFDTTTLPANTGGQAWVEYDNVSVTACQGAIAGDVNGDCRVTFADFALLAGNWQVCGNTANSSLCQ